MSDGVFRRPFELPRPAQVRTIGILTKPVTIPVISFPPWKAPSIILSGIFSPMFALPRSTQGMIPSAAVVVSGRIMSSMAGFGGLAGSGGIAGQGGGLAG